MRKRAPQQLVRLRSGPIQQGIAAEAANLLQIVRTASQSEGWAWVLKKNRIGDTFLISGSL